MRICYAITQYSQNISVQRLFHLQKWHILQELCSKISLNELNIPCFPEAAMAHSPGIIETKKLFRPWPTVLQL